MLIKADARTLPLKDEVVQCVVTSPPYWGLRDYGVPGQLGLEKTPEEYVANMVEVFREVRRVLRRDGTLWLNLGDSYAGNRSYQVPDSKHRDVGNSRGMTASRRLDDAPCPRSDMLTPGLKPKDLVGIPWRVAFALQADGWYLRSDIIWAKPNPMPESVTDRPTKAHEYIFLMSKSAKYYYNAAAIFEPAHEGTDLGLLRGKNAGGPGADKITWHANSIRARQDAGVDSRTANTRVLKQDYTGNPTYTGFNARYKDNPVSARNKRTVWSIATQPYSGAHFATFPEEIPRLCILAGSRPGDVILDPFGGSGTTAKVALELGRKPVHIDLTYHELARKRASVTPAMPGLMR